MSTFPQLSNLRRKADFYEHDAPKWARNIWSRPKSFEWFTKTHRKELIAQGAMLKIGRDYFIDVEKFPAAAIRILGLVHEGESQEKQEHKP